MLQENGRRTLDQPALIFHRINSADAEDYFLLLNLRKGGPSGVAVVRSILPDWNTVRVDEDPPVRITKLEQSGLFRVAGKNGIGLRQELTRMKDRAKGL